MDKRKFNKRECNLCGKSGEFFQKNKWWCSKQTDMGFFNITGYCKTKRKSS